jgi:stage V sporulation protein G
MTGDNGLDITRVDIALVEDSERGLAGKLLAYANVTFNNCFLVRSMKVIRKSDGSLMVAMPSRKSVKNGKFRDLAHPLNEHLRQVLEDEILEHYRDKVGSDAD